MRRLVFLLAFLVAACDDAPTPRAPAAPAPSDPAPAPAPDRVDVQGLSGARAELAPVGGSGVGGSVELQRVGRSDGVRVLARIRGAEPDRHYGFQILLGRSCDADPDVHLGAELGRPHGTPYRPAAQRHLGDLGNVRGDDSGVGRYDRIDTVLTLDGVSSPAGRAVVLRDRRDDGVTAPAGAAGDVVACGVLSGGPL